MISIYIAASYRHFHAVRLLSAQIRDVCPLVNILDWTEKAVPPEGLTSAERRAWMDTDHGDEVYDFCAQACTSADLVVYLGESGQDAGVEVGMAKAAGIDVIGLPGPLESPGLMLHGAVTVWAKGIAELMGLVRERIKASQDLEGTSCASCPLFGCDGERLDDPPLWMWA